MVDDRVVNTWVKFLEYLNSLGFNYYIGKNYQRHKGVYDEEGYRFVAHEEDENWRNYLFYESCREYFEGEINTRSLMLHSLPEKYTVEKWREQRERRVHAYQLLDTVQIYPKYKTRIVLSEFRELMI